MLVKAGFTYRSGKGSHTVWTHALLPYSLVLSGQDRADADRYQEKDVKNALRDLDNLNTEKEEDNETEV